MVTIQSIYHNELEPNPFLGLKDLYKIHFDKYKEVKFQVLHCVSKKCFFWLLLFKYAAQELSEL